MFYYIHGYQSNPESTKGTLFKETLDATPIRYRQGKPEDLVINDCVQNIYRFIQHDKQAVLIGSSLGGFLAAATALEHSTVRTLILLNPAVIPPSTNLETITGMPRRILEDMIKKPLFTKKIPAEIIIFRGTNDTIVPDNWVFEFAKTQEATMMLLHDDHQFSRTATRLPRLIQKFLR